MPQSLIVNPSRKEFFTSPGISENFDIPDDIGAVVFESVALSILQRSVLSNIDTSEGRTTNPLIYKMLGFRHDFPIHANIASNIVGRWQNCGIIRLNQSVGGREDTIPGDISALSAIAEDLILQSIDYVENIRPSTLSTLFIYSEYLDITPAVEWIVSKLATQYESTHSIVPAPIRALASYVRVKKLIRNYTSAEKCLRQSTTYKRKIDTISAERMVENPILIEDEYADVSMMEGLI